MCTEVARTGRNCLTQVEPRSALLSQVSSLRFQLLQSMSLYNNMNMILRESLHFHFARKRAEGGFRDAGSNESEVSHIEMFVISFCQTSMFSLRSTVSSVLLLSQHYATAMYILAMACRQNSVQRMGKVFHLFFLSAPLLMTTQDFDPSFANESISTSIPHRPYCLVPKSLITP